MGGDSMSHMTTTSAGVEPALYYAGQKRPGDDGGEDDVTSPAFVLTKDPIIWSYKTILRSS